MAFLALGINHKTASVAVRERVAFTPEKLVEALRELCRLTPSREAAILSTCNRSELYLEQDALAVDEVLAWLANFHQLNVAELRDCAYVHADEAAVRHLMRVACGLDSMVLGEPQILGQMKSAFAVAQDAATIGSGLYRVFDDVFSVAKQVRTETAIGENPVSVAFAAVTLAQQIFSDIHRASALMIGAGRTIELVVQHLKEAGVASIVVANRTLTHALELKRKYGVREVLLSDIPEELVRADVVVSSTASQLPILGKGCVESALKARRHKPIFMVDLAVPRDIEPEVAQLRDVYLYTVDDLRHTVEENMKSRLEAAKKAEEIIDREVEHFLGWLRAQGATSTIRDFRERAHEIRAEALQRAKQALRCGKSPEEALDLLANLLTNKLI